MDAIKLCGLYFFALTCVFSCRGDSQTVSQSSTSPNQLSNSYSIALPLEMTSDSTVTIALNRSQSADDQQVTVESWSSSLSEPLKISSVGEGKFSFIAPQDV